MGVGSAATCFKCVLSLVSLPSPHGAESLARLYHSRIMVIEEGLLFYFLILA